MNRKFKRTAIALLLAPALGIPALAVHAAGQQTQQPAKVDAAAMYRNTWSAEAMLDAEVRGPNGEEIGEVKDILVGNDGKVSRVIVEVGGFLELGDQHIGVPWKDVTMGGNLEWIQVPLKQVESGKYSLYGRVPEGERVDTRRSEWRVNEVIGDYASLRDVPRYGLVADIVFDESGQAQAVIVDRRAGEWGAAGAHGHPYQNYEEGWVYAMPIDGADARDLERFDYERFARESRFASADRKQRSKN